jgi:PHP family Zn ribbon phosphoesterase
MNLFRADLHIHSVLSPCGDLEMSPGNIVKRAARKGLDLIAITDHNHTGHARLTRKLGEAAGLWVVYGVELTTREEVHCLVFFDTDEQLDGFQEEVDSVLPKVVNDTKLFGFQVIVDEKERILSEIEHSLYPGINLDIVQTRKLVHSMGGLFVPAHVDRRLHGLYAQLGFLPEGLEPDAVEISWRTNREAELAVHPELEAFQLIQCSDAHFIEDVGRATCELQMKSRSFEELALAFRGQEGRKVVLR